MLDPKLPQLETALSADAMCGVLASTWLNERYEIQHCAIGHVRHKPGRNCLVRYDVAIRDRVRGVESTQVLSARLYEPGQSESRWARAAAQSLIDVAPGPKLAHMPQLGMVLWAFPNERKLRGLEVLSDAERLRDEVLPALFGCAVDSVESTLVRYIPEHGCTVRVRATANGIERVLYGKLQVGDAARRAFSLMRQFREGVWFHESTQTLWQAEVPGKTAEWADLRACARALARLHQQRVEGLPAAAPTERALSFPEQYAQRAARILDKASARANAPLATLHGDLHLKNFLVDAAGEAELIDLDTLCAGDPLADLGSFAASLFHRAALGEVDYAEALDQTNEFAEEYRRSAPWPVGDADLAAATAHAIITQRLGRVISRRKGDVVDPLLHIAGALVDSAQELMAQHSSFAAAKPGVLLDVHYKTWRKQKSWTKSHVTVAWKNGDAIEVERWGAASGPLAAWRFPQDPAAPWMAIAADPLRVVEHLPLSAARVDAIEILTYRPANRFTARYRLTVDGSARMIYGKTYTDDRGLRVHERFTALAELGILKADPLGYSPAIHTVWQAAFDGEPLRDHAFRWELLHRAGTRLRELHDSGIACPERFTLASMHADVAKKLAKLAVVVPHLEARFRNIVRVLGSRMQALPEVSAAVVHGDCHIRQFMVRGGKEVALFDFDEIGLGDPVEDFGHFLADLHGDGFDCLAAARAAEALLEGYGREIPRERLQWHTAVQLLTRAYRALLQLKPDFEERVARHLALAEEQL